jgi:hypothetical protein
MAVRLHLVIQDEGLLESSAFISLIGSIEHASRNAAVITCIRIANDLKIPPSLIQLASIRIWTGEESLFWIEAVQPGSKTILGKIIAPAIISMALTSTVGESLKEGWRKTDVHAYISSSIPKIERFFADEFGRLFDGDDLPDQDAFYMEPTIIRPDDQEEFVIEIRARQKRSGPRGR